jgi:hypothetical protein
MKEDTYFDKMKELLAKGKDVLQTMRADTPTIQKALQYCLQLADSTIMWTCSECGIKGEYQSLDPSMCVSKEPSLYF